MRIPTLQGIIDRRILINYTVEPEIIKRILPAPFTPKLVGNSAIAGICLIRLKQIRLKGFPAFTGFSSENGAHRIAVEWETKGQRHEGVYVPRRDTSSRLNSMAGGRIFPGRHYHAKFMVNEKNDHYRVSFNSSDNTTIAIDASIAQDIPSTSVFGTLANVSDFFRKGSIGFSPHGNKFEGLELHAFDWKVQPLSISSVHSSFFEDLQVFPSDSVQFDNALLMTQIAHEWRTVPGCIQ